MADIELKLLIGLHRVCNEIDRRSSQIFAQYGLSLGQFAVLEVLYHKGNLSVGEVQKKILSTSGTIPVIVNNLTKRGLVERLTDVDDKRKCILHITEEGKKLMREVFPKNKTTIIDSMSNWSDEEKNQMLKILKKFER
ncbi:MAG TPA: MarR family transcriptional regulator [Firmicutes bacterium]|nr:MarR family transcriptional regulator [Bacillota bacterium]